MSSSFLSLYSDNWTLSDRKTGLIRIESSSTTDSSTSSLLRSNTLFSSPCKINEALLKGITELTIEDTYNETSSLLIAERSISTLNLILRSMVEDNVYLTEKIILHKYIWDFSVYEQRHDEFPLENVPVKCNILKTLKKLLTDYRESNYQLHLEVVAKVLQYLNKLFQASHMEPPVSHRHDRESIIRGSASSLRSAPHHVVDSRQSTISIDTQSIRHPNSTTGSIQSSSGKSRILSKLFSNPRNNRGNNNLSDVLSIKKSTNDQNRQDLNRTTSKRISTSHKIQDVIAMVEYKDFIVQLTEELKRLPKTDKNDIIFNFVDKSVNAFVLKDVRLLLRHYLETEVVLML